MVGPPHGPHLHLDVRYLAVAPPGAVPVGNHESLDLRWVTYDQLPGLGVDGGVLRLARAAGNDPASLAAFLRRPAPALDEQALARVTCPVLLVIGDRDFSGPADRLAAALPDAELVVLRGVDHFAAPRDFTCIDRSLDFLDA